MNSLVGDPERDRTAHELKRHLQASGMRFVACGAFGPSRDLTHEEPKYRPTFLCEARVAAGLLGRKSGRGWYEYGKDGARPVQKKDRDLFVGLLTDIDRTVQALGRLVPIYLPGRNRFSAQNT